MPESQTEMFGTAIVPGPAMVGTRGCQRQDRAAECSLPINSERGRRDAGSIDPSGLGDLQVRVPIAPADVVSLEVQALEAGDVVGLFVEVVGTGRPAIAAVELTVIHDDDIEDMAPVIETVVVGRRRLGARRERSVRDDDESSEEKEAGGDGERAHVTDVPPRRS